MSTSEAAAAANPLEGGAYPAVADVLLRGLARAVQRVFRRRELPSFLFTALCFLLLHLLIFLAFAVLLSIASTLTNNDRLVIAAGAASLPLVTVVVLLTTRMHATFVRTVRDQIAPTLTRDTDRAAFAHWLAASLGMPRQLGLIMISGGLVGPLVVVIARSALAFDVKPITMIVAVVLGLEGAIYFPTFLPVLVLPFQLSRYPLNLRTVDPAHSDLVERLYSVLIANILFMGVFAALVALWMWSFGLLPPQTAIILVGTQWITIFTTFSIGQHGLALIIRRAKQQKLTEIQARIAQIEQSADSTNKDSIETILRLLDYYGQIKTMRDSALDVGAVLSFLQSLLLPLIASLLANITTILQLIKP